MPRDGSTSRRDPWLCSSPGGPSASLGTSRHRWAREGARTWPAPGPPPAGPERGGLPTCAGGWLAARLPALGGIRVEPSTPVVSPREREKACLLRRMGLSRFPHISPRRD